MNYLEILLNNATKEMMELKHPYRSTEHLMLELLKDQQLMLMFEEYGITYKSFKDRVIKEVGIGSKEPENIVNTPLLTNVIERAENIAKRLDTQIDSRIMACALFQEGEGVTYRILCNMDIDVFELCADLESLISARPADYIKQHRCLIDLNKEVEEDQTIVTGLDKELEELIKNLLRLKKPNTILLGEPGVGKTALVEKLAQAINNKEVPEFLQDLRIIQLSLGGAVAGTKYRGEFEEKIQSIISEVEKHPNTILFIDEIHTIRGAGGAEGAIDASNLFKPSLARGKIRMIGATTVDEYEQYIKPDKALARRFNTIKLLETTKEETINILMKAKAKYEKHYNIKISKKDIENIYKEATHKSGRMPDIALDSLEEYSVNRYYENKKKEVTQ